MQRTRILIPVLVAALCALPGAGTAQQKLAQTGMKFLNVITDARTMSLGGAVTALEQGASSLFFNPAGMARTSSVADFTIGRVQWIADIRHDYVSAAISPFNGEYGVLGLMIHSVNYGKLDGTIRSTTNAAGFIDLGQFSPYALMVGVGYARVLSDKFAVGGAVKWVRQDLGSGVVALVTSGYTKSGNVADLYAFDFGLNYHTGFKSLQFGMAIRNFSKEARFIDEGFQLPLTFKIGAAMDVLDFASVDQGMHKLVVGIDAEHPRDFVETVQVGAEYLYDNMLAFRTGFVSHADEHQFSFGLGLQLDPGLYRAGLDYAYTPFGIFDNVHTFTLKLTF